MRFVDMCEGYTAKQSVFSSKSVKKSVNRGVRNLKRAKRASLTLSPISLSVLSLVPDLLFDCSRVLKYVKIGAVKVDK